MVEPAKLKQDVHQYWNQASCGTELAQSAKFSPAYFAEIEQARYRIEPEIFSFAQFTRAHGKKLLEIGVGAGTDFVQWVRAGARAHGIDLTQEALENTRLRLAQEGLQAADLRVADAEHLPYPNDYFDWVYSWGVIHHSPDTPRCLAEIVRVTKPGGTIKLMIYNRHSLFAFYRYLLAGLVRGKPWRSLSNVLFYDQESPGTKAYTLSEARCMLAGHPLTIISLKATVSQHDLLYYKSAPFRFAAYCCAALLGWHRIGWFLTIEATKNAP